MALAPRLEEGERLVQARPDRTCRPGTRAVDTNEMMHVWFTRDLRSAYALHGPVRELCLAGLLPRDVCDHDTHGHDSRARR